MKIDAFALDLVVNQGKRVGPGFEGVFEAERTATSHAELTRSARGNSSILIPSTGIKLLPNKPKFRAPKRRCFFSHRSIQKKQLIKQLPLGHKPELKFPWVSSMHVAMELFKPIS